MTNTMADLRNEVASRMHNTLDGREIDMMENRIEVPHMLGITPVGKYNDRSNEEGTLLDPDDSFWDEYIDDVSTRREVSEAVETAIRSLREDGTFEMTYPYGEEAEIAYIEVERPYTDSTPITATCDQCGEQCTPTLSMEPAGSNYSLTVRISCDECSFSASYSTNLIRS